MQYQIRQLVILLFIITFCACDSMPGKSGAKISERASWVARWTEIAGNTSGLDHTAAKINHGTSFGEQMGPTRTSRVLAMLQIAMFDAVNSIEPQYQTYLETPLAPQGASMKASIAQAAHDVLIHHYPNQKELLDGFLAEDLGHIADGESKEDGILVGQLTAAQIIADRTGDGSEFSSAGQSVRYNFSSAPGAWQKDPLHPNQSPLTPDWGKVKPFAISSASTFRPPAPPTLNSEEYANAYEEVKKLGGDGITTPTERTEDQTIAGIFWGYDGMPDLCAPVKLYNQIALQVAEEIGLDIHELSRLLTLVNIAMADAGIASWEAKYYWNLWRPITGIRQATGALEPDANFTPLGAPANNGSGLNFTPAFPAYPSGHATFGGALFQTLRNFIGTDDYQFTFVSDEYNGVTVDQNGQVRPYLPRTFQNFSEAEEENGQSRIYLGIHWSFDKTAGITLGRQIADVVTGGELLKAVRN